MVDVKKTMATTLISSKQWPQPEVHDPSSISMATDKINPPSLKCPRCDSSNTKFCYYNNYSLSQPRHFCKACKRYWTRGGTLRNVPVGGGCRKNKRLKRPQLGISNSTPTSAVVNPSFDQSLNSSQIDHSSFYNSRSPDPNFTIPSLIRVPAGFDFHPPMNLGFSSSTIPDDLIRGMQSSHPTVWNPNPDPNPNPNPNPTEHVMSSDPSSSLLWWFDPSTMGSSSVPSLI